MLRSFGRRVKGFESLPLRQLIVTGEARASAARNIKIWAGAFSEETQGLILTLTGTMKRFYFDLVGDLPARDILG
jgi:hypothetical protein